MHGPAGSFVATKSPSPAKYNRMFLNSIRLHSMLHHWITDHRKIVYPPARLIAGLRVLLLVLAGSPITSAGGLILVDGAGSADFVNIQDAVTSSMPGDLILILEGEYEGFTVANQSVHLAAQEGALVTVSGTITVRDIPLDGLVTLRGLDSTGTWSPDPAAREGLALRNCQGSIRVTDCYFQGFPGNYGETPAAKVESCDDVTFSSCGLTQDYGDYGSEGLLATDSNLGLFRTVVEGGISSFLGADGVHLVGRGGQLFATGCTFAGGAGLDGYCYDFFGSDGGDGGIGLFNEGWSVSLQNTALAGGWAGWGATDEWGSPCADPGTAGVASVGPVSLLPGIGPELEMQGVSYLGSGALDVRFHGLPGQRVFLMASFGGGFELSDRYFGPRLLADPLLGTLNSTASGVGQLSGGIPLGIQSSFMGYIDALGGLEVQIPMLPGVAMASIKTVQFQAVVLEPGGYSHWVNPNPLVILPCSTGLDCNGNGVGDGCDLASGTSQDCNGNGLPDECEWDCNSNGSPDDCDILAGTSLDQNGNGTPDECEGLIRLHVDINAAAGGDGLTWSTALNDLQAALDLHASHPFETEEIWVAQGVYKPSGSFQREMSFVPGDEVRMRGGFAGTETQLAQRNLSANETVLSGDLAGDDLFPAGMDENSYSVLRMYQADNVLVDGFTIRGGNSNINEHREGGGIDIKGCRDFVVSRCTIERNSAAVGGGAVIRGFPDLESSGDFINCIIRDNAAETLPSSFGGWAGGIGLLPWLESVRLIGCEIIGNHASKEGGAVYASSDSGQFLACTIADNTCDEEGGGIQVLDEHVVIQGSVIWGNRSLSGLPEFDGQLTGGDWYFVTRRSCVEGPSVFPGQGNINDDPKFVNQALGDYRLGPGSPCIDGGRNGALLATDPSDLDQDGVIAEGMPLDVAGVTRRLDDPNTADTGSGSAPLVDMGANEFDPGRL